MKNIIIILSVLISSLSFAQTKVMTESEFIEKAMKAIKADDPETIEVLRDKVKPEFLPALMKHWNADLPWTQKNGFIALLMDQLSDVIRPVMEDGLNSNMPENRAVAICILKKDFNLHKILYDQNGWVIEKKVDEEIAKYRKSLKAK